MKIDGKKFLEEWKSILSCFADDGKIRMFSNQDIYNIERNKNTFKELKEIIVRGLDFWVDVNIELIDDSRENKFEEIKDLFVLDLEKEGYHMEDIEINLEKYRDKMNEIFDGMFYYNYEDMFDFDVFLYNLEDQVTYKELSFHYIKYMNPLDFRLLRKKMMETLCLEDVKDLQDYLNDFEFIVGLVVNAKELVLKLKNFRNIFFDAGEEYIIVYTGGDQFLFKPTSSKHYVKIRNEDFNRADIMIDDEFGDLLAYSIDVPWKYK